MNLRKTTSLTTLLSFLILLATSIAIYLSPQGKVAYWANWNLLGLDKEQWGALHTNIGLLFIVAGSVHTLLNGKALAAYLKNKARRFRLFTADFNLALLITLAVAVLTLMELPPVHSIQQLGESIKANAAAKYGDPPYGHAETSSLKIFCQRMGLSLDESLQKLTAAGLNAVTAEATLAEISTANGIPPQAVYNLIQSAPSGEAPASAQQKSGMGRKTLAELSAEYGLAADQVIQNLAAAGITASAGQTVKEIAEQNGTTPSALNETIATWANP